MMTLMLKEINEQPAVLDRLLKENKEPVKLLCEEIRKRGIDFAYMAARGTSDHAAVYAKYILETHAGIPVAFAAPSVITVYKGRPRLENALVIGISQSGDAEDVLEVLKEGRKQGAVTVAIKNYPDSPMAQEAQWHLDCLAGEEKSVAATKTFTAQMMIMAMITANLTNDDTLKRQLDTVPALVNGFLTDYGINDELVDKYKQMQECFVLARGMNYSIAMEGALKIQETCYVRAKAYSMSDFYHGPLALLEPEMPVILIATGIKTKKVNGEMIKTLIEHGVEPILITDNDEMESPAGRKVVIPEAPGDFTSPFITAAAVQLFACKLSLAKGLDPDNPRNIKKVTITK